MMGSLHNIAFHSVMLIEDHIHYNVKGNSGILFC